MPQIATVGLVAGFRDKGAIGTQQESAVFRCNTRVCSVLRDSGLVERKDPLGGTLTLAFALTPMKSILALVVGVISLVRLPKQDKSGRCLGCEVRCLA